MILLIIGLTAVLFVATAAFALARWDGHRAEDKREGKHRTSRPGAPRSRAGKVTRAWRRFAHGRRPPGNTELHHEKPLPPEDAATITWVRQMRALRHPGWTVLALRGHIAILNAITNAPRSNPRPATCRHGWPGISCGSAHPYIPEPTSVPGRQAAPAIPPSGPLGTPAGGSTLITGAGRAAAEVEATRPWAEDTGSFAAIAADWGL